MKIIIGVVVSILLFALVPIFAHWWWDVVCAVEIIIIGAMIASNYIYIGERNVLPKNKSKHRIRQENS
jgi:hypothetical protein